MDQKYTRATALKAAQCQRMGRDLHLWGHASRRDRAQGPCPSPCLTGTPTTVGTEVAASARVVAARRGQDSMSTQPVHRHEPDKPRVQHTIGDISDALHGSRRAQFFAELLQAQQGQELDDVLNAWWGRAMLDTDPDRYRIHAAAVAGTLPTTTLDEILRRRRERSAP